ncbi:MAG: phage tail tape measure protein, partial [Roseovarius sp.]
VAAKVGTAFDISAGEAGTNLAHMMTALGLGIDDVMLLSDSMNVLSNNQAATAAQIMEVVNRVGAQGTTFGLAAKETAAFASAMVAAGAESNVAATSLRNMGRALTRGDSATKRQRDAYAALGMDARSVAEDMQRDATGTIMRVLEAIQKIPEAQRAAVTSDLFGNEARALAPLATNLDLVRESLGLVADDSKNAGSATREFEARIATFEARMQLFSNRLTEIKITIGNALIPVLTQLMDALAPVIDRISEFISAYPDLTANALTAAGALVAFKVGLAGLRFVGLLGRGGALALLSGGLNAVGATAGPVARAVKESVRLQNSLAAMQGMKVGTLGKIRAGLSGLAGVSGLSAVAAGIKAVVGAVAVISAPAWLAIGAAVAAVGVAWKYWDRITAIVSGVASAVGEELRPVFDWLGDKLGFMEPLLSPVGAAFRTLGDGVSWALDKIKAFFSGDLFKREKLSKAEFASIKERARGAARAVIETIKGAFRDFFDWIAGIPGRIIDSIGRIDLGGIIDWPEPPAWWKALFGGDEAAAPAAPTAAEMAAEARAAGADPRARAAATVERVAAEGPLPTKEHLSGLRGEAEALRGEIAALQREIRSTPAGRGAARALAPKRAELERLKGDLAETEAGLADGEARAGELQAALQLLSETEATPEIDQRSIDRALERARQLERTLGRIDGGARAGAPAPAPAPRRARRRGGPISRGEVYMTGEDGPEAIVASRSAYVMPSRITERIRERISEASGPARAMVARGLRAAVGRAHAPARAAAVPIAKVLAPAIPPAGGAGGTPEARPAPFRPERAEAAHTGGTRTERGRAQAPSITVNATFDFSGASNLDAEEVAASVRRAMQDELRELLRGVYSDIGVGSV